MPSPKSMPVHGPPRDSAAAPAQPPE
jgi:hypothetical protein